MGDEVPYCPETAAATDPDSPSLLNITIAPAPNLGICQESSHHDSQALNTIRSRTAPRTSHTHDDGHIHRASPVRGLPPEQESIDDTLATMHNAQEGMPLPTTETPFITTGQKLRNNSYEPHKPITATTRFATAHNQTAVEPPPLPSPPDANDGPEAVMKAIDAWLDYQDHLDNKQALSPPHRSEVDEEYHPPPGIDGRPMEQQPNVRLCQTITTKQAPQLGNQLNGLRALRKRFSWRQGFLKAHKPPTRQSTPWS